MLNNILSFDLIDRMEANYNQVYEVRTPKFLSSLRTSCTPNNKIKLKF